MSGLMTTIREKAARAMQGGLAGRGRELIQRLTSSGVKETISVTVEHGIIKLLVTSGLEVIDYRIALANPLFFREGLISDSGRMATILETALEDVPGERRSIIGAVPGYQSTLGRLELPNAKGLDPDLVVPREASRTMGISLDRSYVTWTRLPDNVDRARWLVLSANRRSITSLTDTITAAGMRMSTMELRPFALARAVSKPDAIIAWTAPDGCDTIIVRNWVPVTHQSAYWGAEPVDSSVLANRLTDIISRTVAVHEESQLDMPLPAATSVYVTGSPVGLEPGVRAQVAANLQRTFEDVNPPLKLPPDFPIDDLVVNVGLALWEA